MRKGVVFAVILAGLCGQSMAAFTISDQPSVAVVDQKIAPSAPMPTEVAEEQLPAQPAYAYSLQSARSLLSGSGMGAESAIRKLPSVKDENVTDRLTPVSRGIASNKNSTPITADPEEVELLARAIYAEARGEPFLGQVAVGAVIVNRAKSRGFPSTIREVIYQPGALCTVKDGQINLKPGETARRAAKMALSGVDPTNGSLYFFNPAYATAQWTKKKPVAAEIGNHVFAR